MSQKEMGQLLGVDQTTISDDITALKEMSQRFVYDLARSDLVIYYKSCIDGIEDAKAQAWEIYSKSQDLSTKDQLAALRLIVDCNVECFKLMSEGPSVLAMKALEDRLSRIETTATTLSKSA